MKNNRLSFKDNLVISYIGGFTEMNNYFHKIGMKKNVILLFFVAISTFAFAKQTLTSIEPVEILETFISNENNKRKNFISYEELENDIDYWALGCDLNETIFLETNDSEMKEKLKNIEFRLL